MLPRVTVIVSSFNRPKLIRDALDSVLAQAGVDIQCIVADDWSDDPTQAVLDEYGSVAVVQPGHCAPTMEERHQNGGGRCAMAIDAALGNATGEFVAFLPDDDFLTPGSLACRARFLVEHPEANVVYGRLEACKVAGGYWPQGRHGGEGELVSDFYAGITMPEGYTKPGMHYCTHDRNGFWSEAPIARAANRLDHGMVLVRRRDDLPAWPTMPTVEMRRGDGTLGEALHPSTFHDYGRPGEVFDCPDAGWFYRLECAGLGPFYSVPDIVVVKRYDHGHGHRSDPRVRE